MLVGNAEASVWRFRFPELEEYDVNNNTAQRVMVCLAEAIPAAATGLVVWLRGGPIPVAVLVTGGVGFASVVAVKAVEGTLAKIAENYQADRIEIEELQSTETR